MVITIGSCEILHMTDHIYIYRFQNFWICANNIKAVSRLIVNIHTDSRILWLREVCDIS